MNTSDNRKVHLGLHLHTQQEAGEVFFTPAIGSPQHLLTIRLHEAVNMRVIFV